MGPQHGQYNIISRITRPSAQVCEYAGRTGRKAPPPFFVLQDCLEEDSGRRLEGVMLARNSGMNTGRLLHALILVVFGAMGTCTCILGLLISRDKTTLR